MAGATQSERSSTLRTNKKTFSISLDGCAVNTQKHLKEMCFSNEEKQPFGGNSPCKPITQD